MTANISIPIITVDGPSGAGKGTLGRRLATELGWHFLDSGALYRVLAYAAIQQNLDFSSAEQLSNAALQLDVQFLDRSIIWAGQDVTRAIREVSCSEAASKVSAVPEVRTALLDRQRAFQQAPGLVADGRDMGTVVFPDAPLKIFLDASCEERARRRFQQLQERGVDVSLSGLLRDLEERDRRDRQRPVAPLKPAGDALLFDTTSTDADQVYAEVLALVQERRLV